VRSKRPSLLRAELAREVETREVAPGLWLWRQERGTWTPDADWHGPVSSWCVESRDETLVLDALAPPPESASVWERLDTARPDTVVVLKPDHVRSAVELAERWWAPVFGPPEIEGELGDEVDFRPFDPGDELPGGLLALDDKRGRRERPVFLPEQLALVFADGMTALDEGALRIWDTEKLEDALPAFRKMLELPFTTVCVSHGDPVHDRAEFEAALERDPYRG
jgi:glyoxylase-like metal-dependent hydrolase (beta-lactamase superfamily II)